MNTLKLSAAIIRPLGAAESVFSDEPFQYLTVSVPFVRIIAGPFTSKLAAPHSVLAKVPVILFHVPDELYCSVAPVARTNCELPKLVNRFVLAPPLAPYAVGAFAVDFAG
ncbi:hypothetical protein D3C76_964230 [compost metagenome]